MKTFAIIGLGNRGSVYADELYKNDDAKIVAVCDTNPAQLKKAVETYSVKTENTFLNEEEFFKEKHADVLVIATMDQLHFRHLKSALALGYTVLLEKPVSPSDKECEEMGNLAKEAKKDVIICHNLRYAPFYQTLKRLVTSGKIGNVVTIEQSENVGYWHYMCSFIRGKWGIEEVSSPIVLQKCCHDLDIVSWLVDKDCVAISSVGDLSFYTKKNKPNGAAESCCSCAEKGCPFNAVDFYNEAPEALCVPYGFDYSKENIFSFLSEKNNRYGKCVFALDNNVCDRQIVSLRYENGVTANLLLHGFAEETDRITKVFGTKGYICGNFNSGVIEIYDGKSVEKVDVNELIENGSHNGGDANLVREVVEYLESGKRSLGMSFLDNAVKSHKIAFLSEISRKSNGAWIDAKTGEKAESPTVDFSKNGSKKRKVIGEIKTLKKLENGRNGKIQVLSFSVDLDGSENAEEILTSYLADAVYLSGAKLKTATLNKETLPYLHGDAVLTFTNGVYARCVFRTTGRKKTELHAYFSTAEAFLKYGEKEFLYTYSALHRPFEKVRVEETETEEEADVASIERINALWKGEEK